MMPKNPVRVTEKNGGMASGIFRASARIALVLSSIILVAGLYFLLRA